MHFTHQQAERALHIISDTPWGDVAVSLTVIDDALAIAMRATREEFLLWETEHDKMGLVDEFSISNVDALAPRWRHALVARLLRTIAMAYGMGTDYARDEIGQIEFDHSCAGTVVRQLLETVTTPPQKPKPEPTPGDRDLQS